VIGGWIAREIAGILRSEPAMLHGAITWCVAVPLLVALAAVGASNHFGGWFGSLAGTANWAAPAIAPFERPDPLAVDATTEEREQFRTELAEYRQNLRK
jgi:hypothetical protein